MKNRNLSDKIKQFFLERKYVLWLLLWLVYGAWFYITGHISLNYHEIHLPIDDKIPFIEYFIVFYVAWYLYIAISLLYTLFKSKRDFLMLISLIFISLFASMIVCTAYPSKMTARPLEMPHNPFSTVVQWIYAADNGTNVLPSMHCIVAIVITVGLCFAETMKGKTAIKILLGFFAAGICMSTFFIKQHSFADFLLATAMSIPTCLVTLLVIVPRIKPETAPSLEKAAEPLPEPTPEPANAVLFMANEKVDEKKEEE